MTMLLLQRIEASTKLIIESQHRMARVRQAMRDHLRARRWKPIKGGIDEPSPRPSRMHTVLVVDDRPDARYIMTRPLTLAGFDVRETATGRDALRLARRAVDAIVLDLALLDMDGFEVLRRLKEDPATRDIPVVLKTAVYRHDGHRERALKAGARAYFAEPFDPQALVAAVRGALGDGHGSGSGGGGSAAPA
jgi:CheY-like chemotaxis protein